MSSTFPTQSTADQVYRIDSGPMGIATEAKSWVTVWRGDTQFFITIESARVKDTHFGKTLLPQIESYRARPQDSQGSLTNPIDLIYFHFLPCLERLAPQTSLRDVTLESFLHFSTYRLELVDAINNGDTRIVGEAHCLHTPAFFISPMRTTELLESCKATAHFQASSVWISRRSHEANSVHTVQGEVITPEGSSMYFKPRVDGREEEFEREVRILSRIEELGLRTRIKVPQLRGIVVSGEAGETTIGMLMALIRSPEKGEHLQSPCFWGELELHRKWEKQVTDVVQELHAAGIVWGDVNPMNVVIDDAMDAWVIDFGGMNNIAFVDEEKRETVEGDWQGVKRLFQEWLPGRYALSKE